MQLNAAPYKTRILACLKNHIESAISLPYVKSDRHRAVSESVFSYMSADPCSPISPPSQNDTQIVVKLVRFIVFEQLSTGRKKILIKV